MTVAIVLVALMVAVAVAIRILGGRLPAVTEVRLAIDVPVAPEVAFAVAADLHGSASWQRALRGIQSMPVDAEGRDVWREQHHGGAGVRVVALERVDGRLLRRRLGERGDPAHVDWALAFEAEPSGARLILTETAQLPSHWSRIRERWAGDDDRFARKYLVALGKRLGVETPQVMPLSPTGGAEPGFPLHAGL